MLAMILRVLGLIFAVWLFRRLLSAFSGSFKGAGARSGAGGPSNHMVKDPVCGMYMDSRLAYRLESRRENIYFCSEECKNKYIDHPAGSGTAGSVS